MVANFMLYRDNFAIEDICKRKHTEEFTPSLFERKSARKYK
jgi:hypothetical protein